MRWNNPIKQDKVNKKCNSVIGLLKKTFEIVYCPATVLMHHKFLFCGLDYKYSGDNLFNTCISSAKWKPVLKETMRSLESLL